MNESAVLLMPLSEIQRCHSHCREKKISSAFAAAESHKLESALTSAVSLNTLSQT
jgi:hypothetical protein